MTTNLKYKVTPKRFTLIEFIDLYGKKCSLQESSLSTDNAIWLGVDAENGGSRMHLNVEQVASLLPILSHFIENGFLPEEAMTNYLIRLDSPNLDIEVGNRYVTLTSGAWQDSDELSQITLELGSQLQATIDILREICDKYSGKGKEVDKDK